MNYNEAKQEKTIKLNIGWEWKWQPNSCNPNDRQYMCGSKFHWNNPYCVYMAVPHYQFTFFNSIALFDATIEWENCANCVTSPDIVFVIAGQYQFARFMFAARFNCVHNPLDNTQ